MVSISKVVGLMSCGFLLCLGLSNAAQAENAPGPSDVMKEGARTITGTSLSHPTKYLPPAAAAFLMRRLPWGTGDHATAKAAARRSRWYTKCCKVP